MQQNQQSTTKRPNWDATGQRIGQAMTEPSAQEAALLEGVFSEAESKPSGEKAMSPEKVQAILEERARALAKTDEVESGEMMQLVVFSLGDETYGIATNRVRGGIHPLRDVSPVPCTPNFVVGIINIRGAIYSVIDIRSFFGLPERERNDLTKVILVDAAGLEVGILADDVLGETSVSYDEIKPPLATRAGTKEEYVHGVTSDMLIIINLDALLRDERIIVHEEVA